MSEDIQEQNTKLAKKLEALQQNNVPISELYSTIWALGKAEYQPAKSTIERFLTYDGDEEIRIAALQVLIIRFGVREREYWEMARDLLTNPFSGNRIDGASLLGYLKRNTQDEETLCLLAPIVSNPEERRSVRRSAYAAMRGIMHFDPFEIAKIDDLHFDIEHNVDWDFVNRYQNS